MTAPPAIQTPATASPPICSAASFFEERELRAKKIAEVLAQMLQGIAD